MGVYKATDFKCLALVTRGGEFYSIAMMQLGVASKNWVSGGIKLVWFPFLSSPTTRFEPPSCPPTDLFASLSLRLKNLIALVKASLDIGG